MALTFLVHLLFGTRHRQSTDPLTPPIPTVTHDESQPEVKTKPIHLGGGDQVIVLYYLFLLAIQTIQKNKNVQEI